MRRKFIVSAALVFSAVLIWQARFAFGVMRADWLYFQLDRIMVFWDAQNRPNAAQLKEAQRQVDVAMVYWPNQADYLTMEARISAWQAVTAELQPQADAAMQKALGAVQQALQQRPANPYSWAQYAEYLAASPGKSAELAIAINKVKELAPGDVKLQQQVQSLQNR
jgi:hypothetical protein